MPVDALCSVTHGDDQAVRTQHSIGVEMGLDLCLQSTGGVGSGYHPALKDFGDRSRRKGSNDHDKDATSQQVSQTHLSLSHDAGNGFVNGMDAPSLIG